MTGSTSGIGEEFCYELASRGISILQISRNEEKLQHVAKELHFRAAKAGVSIETDYIIHDFAARDETVTTSFLASLENKLTTLTKDGGVGMLINCVGLSNSLPALLHETSPQDILNMLRVNNDGTTLMMTATLPHMMKRRSGAIITVSSASCTHPTPLLSIYSATKAYGNQITRSAYYEYKEYGIDCLSVTPYYFVSNMYKRKKARLGAPFPDAIVKGCLRHLGHESEVYGYWVYRFAGLLDYIPREKGWRFLETMKGNMGRAKKKNVDEKEGEKKE